MAQELIQNGQLDRQAAVEALREFLEKTVRAAGFQLQVKVSVAEPGSGDAEVLADVDGRDKEILLERGAEVLKALEHLAFRALRLEPEHHDKIHVDCGGFRGGGFGKVGRRGQGAAGGGERTKAAVRAYSKNPRGPGGSVRGREREPGRGAGSTAGGEQRDR